MKEYNDVLKLPVYLKVGSFFPQRFDISESVNLIINYTWKKQKKDLDMIFQNEYDKIKSINEVMGIFQNLYDKMGLLDIIKEEDRSEGKTVILTDESEKILKELMDKYKGKTVTQIIKTLILGVLMNPDYLMDIMVRFSLSQAFLFISLDRISKKYDYKRAKEDFINMSIPRIDVKNIEIENFNYVFGELKKLTGYDDAMAIAKNFGINEQFFKELIGYGLPSMLGIYEGDNLPKSVKPIDLATSKFFSRALPSMVAIKFITIATLYTTLKDTSGALPGSYSTIYDKMIGILLINDRGTYIKQNYEMIYKSMFNTVREWEEYINSFRGD